MVSGQSELRAVVDKMNERAPNTFGIDPCAEETKTTGLNNQHAVAILAPMAAHSTGGRATTEGTDHMEN